MIFPLARLTGAWHRYARLPAPGSLNIGVPRSLYLLHNVESTQPRRQPRGHGHLRRSAPAVWEPGKGVKLICKALRLNEGQEPQPHPEFQPGQPVIFLPPAPPEGTAAASVMMQPGKLQPAMPQPGVPQSSLPQPSVQPEGSVPLVLAAPAGFLPGWPGQQFPLLPMLAPTLPAATRAA